MADGILAEGTMGLMTELEALVRECVYQGRSLDDLRTWLGQHVQAVLDSRDERLVQLDGTCWGLLAELDCGDRTADEVREDLALALIVAAAGQHPWGSGAVTAAASTGLNLAASWGPAPLVV